jgi:ATP-dependent DNA helicase PIF1
LFPDDYDASMIKIPQDLLLETGSHPILAIVSALYPYVRDININPCYFREREMLTPRNITVSEINDCIFNMLPGMKQIYLSTDNVCKVSRDDNKADILYPVEFIS